MEGVADYVLHISDSIHSYVYRNHLNVYQCTISIVLSYSFLLY